MSTEAWPLRMRDEIERIKCRRCGAEVGACFKPQDAAAIAAIQFDGDREGARTEFHFERVLDYVQPDVVLTVRLMKEEIA